MARNKILQAPSATQVIVAKQVTTTNRRFSLCKLCNLCSKRRILAAQTREAGRLAPGMRDSFFPKQLAM